MNGIFREMLDRHFHSDIHCRPTSMNTKIDLLESFNLSNMKNEEKLNDLNDLASWLNLRVVSR